MNKIITLAACLAMTALLHAQTTIFVTPNGTGNGTSWATACNLENAVASTPLSDRTEIWVQKGTYYPIKMLVVPDSVKIYGGFSGTETILSQRNFVANPTIVDGQQKIGSIFRLGMSSELNGLTIQHGNANGTPQKNGGGVWADDNAIIANCIIQNNAAIADGGGVYAKGNLNLISSTVENNSASGNGADLFGSCITQVSTPVVTTHPDIVATGCNDGTFDFGEVSFQTPTEYTITGTVDGQPLTQIWSDAVTATNCQKTAYNGGSSNNYNVDCRSNPDYPGDLFSWCAVARYAATLCPGDWRVPTKDDFVNLDKALGGTGANRSGLGSSNAVLLKYISSWGGVRGSYYHSSVGLYSQGKGILMYYWSQMEENGADYGYNLGMAAYSSGTISSIKPQQSHPKEYGFALRCVR